MKFLPYDSFEIETSFPLEDTIASLKSNVEPKRWLRFSRNHKIFEGEVARDSFKIMRIIHYRNSFLPIIRGTFQQCRTGVKVIVRMGLHPFVIAFIYIWFGGVGIGIIAFLKQLLRNQIQPSPMIFIPFAMLLFGWALVSGGFWFEARKVKILLNDILQRKTTSEQANPVDTG